VKELKKKVSESGLTVSELVLTAWSSASTYRGSDKRGGANGARIALLPQRNWEVNNPVQLTKVLNKLTSIQLAYNAQTLGGKKLSLADLIVLAGNVAIEKAALNAGYSIEVAFTAGRMDAKQADTDIASFDVLEPVADGFRNYLKHKLSVPTEAMLIDRAQLLTLTAPEMTVLIGGMRVLNGNYNGTTMGVFTEKHETLSNDFFKNLLSMETVWHAKDEHQEVFEGRDRSSGHIKYTASRADLVFGSNSELRSLAEVYASDDANEKFVHDFTKAWTKVMNLDRFDIL
jgi:catalase-peroxidase